MSLLLRILVMSRQQLRIDAEDMLKSSVLNYILYPGIHVDHIICIPGISGLHTALTMLGVFEDFRPYRWKMLNEHIHCFITILYIQQFSVESAVYFLLVSNK